MKSRSGTWSYILKRFENVLMIGDLYISLEHNNAKKFCEIYYLKSLIKVLPNSLERVKPCFFVTFNIVKSHIFPENFIEILPVAQKV